MEMPDFISKSVRIRREMTVPTETPAEQLMRLRPSVRGKIINFCYALVGKRSPMNRDLLVKIWHEKLLELSPLEENESHTIPDFTNSPVVQACFFALHALRDDTRLSLVLLEENLVSVLEMKSLSWPARNMLIGVLAKVKDMQKGTE